MFNIQGFITNGENFPLESEIHVIAVKPSYEYIEVSLIY